MKMEKWAKNGHMVQNCYPLSHRLASRSYRASGFLKTPLSSRGECRPRSPTALFMAALDLEIAGDGAHSDPKDPEDEGMGLEALARSTNDWVLKQWTALNVQIASVDGWQTGRRRLNFG